VTKWKLVPVEPTPAMLQDGTMHCGMGMFGTDDEARKVYSAMLAAAPTDPTAEYTPEQARECQHWRGMDGATAWHLIDRHAAGWGDIGRMMDAWLAANREPPNVRNEAPAVAGRLDQLVRPGDGTRVMHENT